jgi:hypothetical protein
MTLVDAALEILREQAAALTAAELAEQAVEAGKVAKVTPAQVKALADKLAKLADAGELTRDGAAFRADGDGGGKGKGGKKRAPTKRPPAGKGKKPAAKKPAKGKKPADDDAADEPGGRSRSDTILDDRAPTRAETAPITELDEDDIEFIPEAMTGFVEPPAAELGKETVDEALASDDEDVAHEAIHALSPEEQELAAVYGDEMGAPATAHGEFKDARSKDEDRPMLPEINAREERHKRWEERRERRDRERQERRERRERREGQGQGQAGGEQKAQGERAPGGNGQRERADTRVDHRAPTHVPTPVPAGTAGEPGVHRVGTPLGDAAAQVFAQLRNSQPLPVRQLAAMMRKRGLIESDPEQVWPHLKAALLGDERSYRALGLRPRIVYRGRDLFAPGPVALAATATAETSLASALGGLAVATHHALKERVARATPPGFERLTHAYLVAAGYRDIDWVKRIAGISYAVALPPGADRQVLISARSGSEPVDRRGIGELRVGVDAKDLLMGVLFAARELSEEAQRELERPGRSITVVCGDALVSALIGAGVGVVSAAAPIRYVDDQLLDELLAGG